MGRPETYSTPAHSLKLANSGQRIIVTHPSAGPLGETVGRSSASRKTGSVGTEEQEVSYDYLLCFGAKLSGSRWG